MPGSFPLQLLLATFAGWVNREQAKVVAYLVAKNCALRELPGNQRLRRTDDRPGRLAAKGKGARWQPLHGVQWPALLLLSR